MGIVIKIIRKIEVIEKRRNVKIKMGIDRGEGVLKIMTTRMVKIITHLLEDIEDDRKYLTDLYQKKMKKMVKIKMTKTKLKIIHHQDENIENIEKVQELLEKGV